MTIIEFLEDLKHYRRQYHNYIELMSNESLKLTCHETIGPLGRQLRHVYDILDVYIYSLDNKKVNFSLKQRHRELEENAELLFESYKNQLMEMEKYLNKINDNDLNTVIQFPGLGNIPYSKVLDLAIQHEALHLGIIYVEAISCGVNVQSPY
jgi:uncharacterized damage-inducible protein DinB